MLASLSHNCFAENSVLESDVLQEIRICDIRLYETIKLVYNNAFATKEKGRGKK